MQIEENILLTVQESDKEEIRVVQWNNYEPVLEKRQTYMKDGEKRNGKCKGFTKSDIELIEENINDIKQALENS